MRLFYIFANDCSYTVLSLCNVGISSKGKYPNASIHRLIMRNKKSVVCIRNDRESDLPHQMQHKELRHGLPSQAH